MANITIVSEKDEAGAQLASMVISLGHAVARTDRAVDVAGLSAAPPDVVIIHQDDPVLVKRLAAQVRGCADTRETPVLAALGMQAALDFAGAQEIDDFLIFPCGEAELATRLTLLLARFGESAAETLAVGDLKIDQANYEVSVEGRPIQLTYKEYELLKYLITHRGRVFSRKVLVERLWGYDYLAGTRTVDVHVRRLRSKLGARYGSMIQTVRNVGYRFSRHP